MKTWQVQDAKARCSALLDTCLAEGPQVVTKRGVEAAVPVPINDWRELQHAARPSLKRRWARLMHRRADALTEVAMIAATAEVHNLTVVTRNVRDFDQLGVATFNPFG
jgi:prevent-host-death family protein